MPLVTAPVAPPEPRVFKTQALLADNINTFGKVQIGFYRFPRPSQPNAFTDFLGTLKITLLRAGFRPSYSWSFDVPSNNYLLVLFGNPYFRQPDQLDDITAVIERIWAYYSGGSVEFIQAFQGTQYNYQQVVADVTNFIASADGRAADKHKRTFGVGRL